jgi:hypothetical protein
LLPALIPSFPVFKADYQTKDGNDKGQTGTTGGKR